jgi:hypothetical protein
MGWEPDLPTIRRGIVLDPFCGMASSGEVALKLHQRPNHGDHAPDAECNNASRKYPRLPVKRIEGHERQPSRSPCKEENPNQRCR